MIITFVSRESKFSNILFELFPSHPSSIDYWYFKYVENKSVKRVRTLFTDLLKNEPPSSNEILIKAEVEEIPSHHKQALFPECLD